ncbi:Suppressor of Profilin deletion [Lithohypha guttulata]|uniref:Suppressor of Profilin deletion n=1 Tax=Lithohypha guttulata TaxID=1690604 RepID=UPI002DE0530F|nr:Suppressor of Profilin deletion [Lithohypha guttulata]
MAQSHENLAAKIQADVENPLRQYPTTSRELQQMGNVSGNLSAIAKELANAQKKAQKLDAKGGSKAEDAKSSVDDATSQWESQAPFVFEQLQALDEARVNHLRDVLTQFQTHELDAIERGRVSAESCLNALLNVETADEIKTFATRAKSQTGSATARRESTLGPSRPAGTNIPPTPPPPRSMDHRGSAASTQDHLAPLPEAPREKKLSGLKRLGTVMGRRKNAAPPPPPSAEKKKERTRSFVPFRRQESSRSFSDLETTGQDLTQTASRDDRASSRHDSERPPQTQESLITDTSSPAPTNGVNTRHAEREAPLPQIAVLQPQNAELPAISPSSPTVEANRRSFQPDPFAQTSDVTSPAEESARNFEIKDQPIPEDASAAQLAMNNIQNQLRMQAQTSGLNRNQASVRGRRDVRNTMFFPGQQPGLPSPATPDLGSPSTPASTLTMPTTATSSTPATTATDTPSDVLTPIKRSLGSGTIPEDASHAVSDSQSIHSAHSMAGLAHHTDLHESGLNASLVETVNTWFSDEGVTRSFVVGEVALAYNRTETTSSSQEVVRLQNFHQLEKCAQNPQFVTTSSGDHQPGTYNVALSSISRSMPTIAFKYQLHMNEANLSAASPLLVTQAWQIIEGQASVILLYSLNPAFGAVAISGTSPIPPPQELILKNVNITVNLDVKSTTGETSAPKAVGAQMMPVQHAQFKKRSSSVVWKFPELLVKPTQERLLVRFMVENNGLAKRGGVDVKFEAHNMLASALGVERLASGGEAATPAADPFADEVEARKSAEGGQRWEDVQSRKVLVSGKYSAM